MKAGIKFIFIFYNVFLMGQREEIQKKKKMWNWKNEVII